MTAGVLSRKSSPGLGLIRVNNLPTIIGAAILAVSFFGIAFSALGLEYTLAWQAAYAAIGAVVADWLIRDRKV